MNSIIFLFVASAQYAAAHEKDAISFLSAQLDKYCRITNEDFSGHTAVDFESIVPDFVNYTLIEDMIIRTVADQTYDVLDSAVSADRYNKLISENRKRTEENWREIQKLKDIVDSLVIGPDIPTITPATTTSGGKSCSGVGTGGKCYVVVVRKMRPKGAKSVCRGMGGKMANIYSLTHYYDVMDYIPQHLSPHDFEILLGMMYNNTDSTVSLSTGGTAPFVSWLPGWPKRKSENTQVALRVNSDKSSSWKGMFNHTPTGYGYHGVLCEM